MKKKDLTVLFGLIMAIYSIGFVTMSAFSSVFLLDVGFSSGQIGTLLAIGSILAVLLQPLAGSLIDKNPKITSREVLLALSGIVVFIGLLIILIPNKSLGLNAFLYCAAILGLMLAQPFLNSFGMEAVNEATKIGYKFNFGVGRSMGSLGYAAGSFLFGKISVIIGPRSIPFAFSLAFFILSILLLAYPKLTSKEDGNDDKKLSFENPLLFFGRYKRFSIMLLGLVLIYFSHALINTFALQVVVPKGGNSSSMGTASAIAAGCELVTTLLFLHYMRKIKLHIIMKISGIFFVLKIFFSFLVTNVIQFYLIQALQMFGWGFAAIGIVYYVNCIVSEKDRAKGQAFAGMSYTVASVIANFLGGFIIDSFGVNTMLLAGTASALVGTAILWITCKEVNTDMVTK